MGDTSAIKVREESVYRLTLQSPTQILSSSGEGAGRDDNAYWSIPVACPSTRECSRWAYATPRSETNCAFCRTATRIGIGSNNHHSTTLRSRLHTPDANSNTPPRRCIYADTHSFDDLKGQP